MAKQAVRQSRRPQHQKQVHLRNTQFQMLPLRRKAPLLCRYHAFIRKRIRPVRPRKQPPAVHPPPQIGRYRHIRRCRHDPVHQRPPRPRHIIQNAPEPRLRRNLAFRNRRKRWHWHHRIGKPPRPVRKKRHLRQPRLQPRWVRHRRHGIPFRTRRHPHPRPERRHLRHRHQPRMVILVPRKRRAPAFDRIGQKTRRAVIRHACELIRQRLHAMPAKVFHQFRKACIIEPVDQCRHITLIAQIIQQPFAPRRPTLKQKCRIQRVRAPVDPAPQRRPPRLRKRCPL